MNLINQAIAQDTAGAGIAQTGYFEPVLLLGFVALFYFLIWRPQSKRAKAHRDLITTLAKGDEVVSSGGILGRVTNISDDHVTLNIADGVAVNMQKQAIVATLPKGTLKAFEGA